MKHENHKRCDTVGFWEGDIDELETRFLLLIFNIFSLSRTFQNIVSHFMLSCVVKTCTFYDNRSAFLCGPRNPMPRIVHSLCFLTDNVFSIENALCYYTEITTSVSTVKDRKSSRPQMFRFGLEPVFMYAINQRLFFSYNTVFQIQNWKKCLIFRNLFTSVTV